MRQCHHLYFRACLCGALFLSLARDPLAEQIPANHPKISKAPRAPDNGVKDQVAQSISQAGLRPVAIRNFIDEFIFAKIKKDGIPRAGLATAPQTRRAMAGGFCPHIDRASPVCSGHRQSDSGRSCWALALSILPSDLIWTARTRLIRPLGPAADSPRVTERTGQGFPGPQF